MDALREIEAEVLRPVNAGELISQAGGTLTACVNYGDAGVLCAEGYRMAALRLLAAIGHDQDFLVYPIIFLYRQYLELRLKDVIALGEALSGDLVRSVPRTHDLPKLWSLAEQHLRREYADCRDHDDFVNDLDAARAVVGEFAALDPEAQTFRYARDTSGRPLLPPELLRIDLGRFARAMATIVHFLDGASTGLGVSLELTRELEAEYR